LSKLDKEESEEAPVKVHEIKFDEYGIMDDGLEATTNEQLKNLKGKIYHPTKFNILRRPRNLKEISQFYLKTKEMGEIFSNFCDLLGIHELS
jgi:hypothetical protein